MAGWGTMRRYLTAAPPGGTTSSSSSSSGRTGNGSRTVSIIERALGMRTTDLADGSGPPPTQEADGGAVGSPEAPPPTAAPTTPVAATSSWNVLRAFSPSWDAKPKKKASRLAKVERKVKGMLSFKAAAASRAALRDAKHAALAELLGERSAGILEARRQVKSMLIYSIFVALLTYATVTQISSGQFFLTQAVSSVLLQAQFPLESQTGHQEFDSVFSTINSPRDVYNYLEGPLTYLFYGDDDPFGVMSESSRPEPRTAPKGTIDGYNTIVGGIRIGQVRASPQACSIPSQLHAVDAAAPTPCWNQDDMGVPQQFGSFHGANWTYTEAKSVESVTSPVTGDALDGVNVYTVLPHPTLRTDNFMDLLTKAVVVDFSVYNRNLDAFCVARIVFEVPPSGGVLPWLDVDTVRVYRDHSFADIVRLVAELAILVFVFGYIIQEARDARAAGGFWNYMEQAPMIHVLNLSLFMGAFVFRGLATYAAPVSIDATGNAFVFLHAVKRAWNVHVAILTVNVFCTWMQIFGYLHFVPKLQILMGTLSQAVGKLSGFGVICAVVLFGSSHAFAMVFGSSVYGFRSLTQSFFSLLLTIVGAFDFESLRRQHLFMGPLMFFIFVLLCSFVLLNMFIAIIADAFNDTKDRLMLMHDFGVQTLAKHVADVAVELVSSIPLVGSLVKNARARKRRRLLDRHLQQLAALADANNDSNISAEEIALALDQDANGQVSQAEVRKALIASGATPEQADETIASVPFKDDGTISTLALLDLFANVSALHPAPPERRSSSQFVPSRRTSAGAMSGHVLGSPKPHAAVAPLPGDHKASPFDPHQSADRRPIAWAMIGSSNTDAANVGNSANTVHHVGPPASPTQAAVSPAPPAVDRDTGLRAINRLRLLIATSRVASGHPPSRRDNAGTAATIDDTDDEEDDDSMEDPADRLAHLRPTVGVLGGRVRTSAARHSDAMSVVDEQVQRKLDSLEHLCAEMFSRQEALLNAIGSAGAMQTSIDGSSFVHGPPQPGAMFSPMMPLSAARLPPLEPRRISEEHL